MSSTTRATVSASGVKRGRPGYDQQSVLCIAVDVFNKHGYEATSMGILAENLGISKSAIYHHVPSKEDLLRLAVEEALGSLESILTRDGATTGPADARLEFVVRGTIAALADKLPFVTLLLRLRGNTVMEREAMGRRRDFDRAVAQLVAAAQEEGTLRTDVDPRTITRLLFGTINSMVEWYKPGGPISASQLADNVIAIAFQGLHR
ncbi:TetR/AcrR family transcriptional regulator [Psychromicrobium xiongbiense]|uniref:TetR/AcrR family transcriptional regulator n=1 Tax=Psychromicrobium xiongbiense TaxID=3051184 RepID=UPI002552E526|nr:TetR/AcrR family transcriptional regulator [Psychromicrobium sp. YIM S02556]